MGSSPFQAVIISHFIPTCPAFVVSWKRMYIYTYKYPYIRTYIYSFLLQAALASELQKVKTTASPCFFMVSSRQLLFKHDRASRAGWCKNNTNIPIMARGRGGGNPGVKKEEEKEQTRRHSKQEIQKKKKAPSSQLNVVFRNKGSQRARFISMLRFQHVFFVPDQENSSSQFFAFQVEYNNVRDS